MNHGCVQQKPKRVTDSGSAVVVSQQPAKSFATFDFPGDGSDFQAGIDQPVFQPLMISLGMVMQSVGFQRGTQRTFTEKNHSIQRFEFQASHESLEIRIQIWTSRGEQDWLHTGTLSHILPQRLELRVPVHQQMRRVPQETIFGRSQVTADLPNPLLIRIGRHPCDLDPASFQFHDDEDVHRHESLHRPDFDRSEIDRSDRLPMGFQERLPRGSTTFPFRSRFDTVLFENVSDRLVVSVPRSTVSAFELDLTGAFTPG